MTVEPLCLIGVTVLVGALPTVSGSAVQPLMTGPVLLLVAAVGGDEVERAGRVEGERLRVGHDEDVTVFGLGVRSATSVPQLLSL